MVAADTVVGILGNVIAILSFTSPMMQFREIVKRKSADNYNGTPYVTTLLSCSLWTLYGMLDPDDGLLIVTVNAAGVALQTLYLTLFLIYSSKEKRVKYFGFVMLDIVFFSLILVVTLVAFHEGSRRTFMGVLCATFTIMMYAAPLAALRATIKTKSVEYMPILLVFFLFINGCVWVTFAVLATDVYVLVPNAVGILLGAIQLCVYLMYRNSTPTTSKSINEVKELEEGSVEKEMKIRGIDMKDYVPKDIGSQAKATSGSGQGRSLTRQDAFPVIRSPSFSPKDRSNSVQQQENDVENGCVD